MEAVNTQIQACETALSKLEPDYHKQLNVYNKVKNEYESMKARIEVLHQKQGRSRQFNTKKARDAFLTEQISSLLQQNVTNTTTLTALQQEQHTQQRRQQDETTLKTQLDSKIRSTKSRLDTINSEIHTQTKSRNDLQDHRKALWRTSESTQEKITETKLTLDKAKIQLQAALPRTISNGLQYIEKLAIDNNIQGYYGPIIDNFKLKNDAFMTGECI